MRAVEGLQTVLDAAALLAVCVLIGGGSVHLLVAAAAIHESAHVAVLRAFGERRVRFTAAGSGFRLHYAAHMMTLWRRLAVSLAGCAANSASAAFAVAFGEYRFAAINAALALFNLLPIEGQDGAEALSALLSRLLDDRRAYFVCRAVSVTFAAALWLASVFVQLRIAPLPQIILASTYLLLRELR